MFEVQRLFFWPQGIQEEIKRAVDEAKIKFIYSKKMILGRSPIPRSRIIENSF